MNGSRVLVPQRVDPERRPSTPVSRSAPSERAKGFLTGGAEAFVAAIDDQPPERQSAARRLAQWAIEREQEGVMRLHTYHGKDGHVRTLLPYLPDEQVGLITIWADGGVSLWRSVFERRAPQTIDPLEELLGKRIGNGNTARDFSDDALSAVTHAYRDASRA